MIKTYIKTAWRSLNTQRAFTSINIAGLALPKKIKKMIGRPIGRGRTTWSKPVREDKMLTKNILKKRKVPTRLSIPPMNYKSKLFGVVFQHFDN